MTTVLNKKNDVTEKTIHLVCTTLCNRKCPNCCNYLYSFDEIPTITKKELEEAENIFLTGGEPFLFAQPNAIAEKLKKDFKNIKRVYIYTNALELSNYLYNCGKIDCIDGLTISIKTKRDLSVFENVLQYLKIDNSRCYYFNGLKPNVNPDCKIELMPREWQPLNDWKPANDSIFRRI